MSRRVHQGTAVLTGFNLLQEESASHQGPWCCHKSDESIGRSHDKISFTSHKSVVASGHNGYSEYEKYVSLRMHRDVLKIIDVFFYLRKVKVKLFPCLFEHQAI
jgi:hypothetical protein